jgi:hypothetical protein
VTSIATASAFPPLALMLSASLSNRSVLRAAQITATPLSASNLAICSPKPLDAPLTIATLPLTENRLSITKLTFNCYFKNQTVAIKIALSL